MDEICSTCLSKHRTLVPLSNIEVISSHLKSVQFAGSPVLVCWECNSRLQKMQAFKAQASKAQELLKGYLENHKPLKALQSLSRLSISRTKTEYDKNVMYCMKQETIEFKEGDLEDDSQSGSKYDTKEHIPKTEKESNHVQESHPFKPLYITVVPLTVSDDRDGYDDSDEWPLSQVTKETVCENQSNINWSSTAVTSTSSDGVSPLLDRGLSRGTLLGSTHVSSNSPTQIIATLSRTGPTNTEPRNSEIEQNDGLLNKEEENFGIKIMSYEEMQKLREEDRQNARYLSSPFKCTSCITGYFLEEKYNAHLLIKHSEELGSHTCDICLTRHKIAESLSRHRETHFRLYHCKLCLFATHKAHLMLAHQTEHGSQFRCEICGVSTATKGKLRYHMNKMHKEDPKCKTCGKQFASLTGMRKHILVKHTEGELEKCKICCGSYRNLAAHARTSCGPEAFCVECGVSFKNKLTYKRHLIAHPNHRHQSNASAIKWYVCDECGSRFTYKSSLTGHIASIHTRIFPFNCHICQKGYRRASELKNHILERHEGGERPRKNVCSYCGKAFKDKTVLVSHIRTHTGERPYKCPHCPWSFTQNCALTTHMRAKHPGEVTGNIGKSARGGGNTDDGGKAEKSGKGKNEP